MTTRVAIVAAGSSEVHTAAVERSLSVEAGVRAVVAPLANSERPVIAVADDEADGGAQRRVGEQGPEGGAEAAGGGDRCRGVEAGEGWLGRWGGRRRRVARSGAR